MFGHVESQFPFSRWLSFSMFLSEEFESWWMCSRFDLRGLRGKETEDGPPKGAFFFFFFASESLIGLLHINHLCGCSWPSCDVKIASCLCSPPTGFLIPGHIVFPDGQWRNPEQQNTAFEPITPPVWDFQGGAGFHSGEIQSILIKQVRTEQLKQLHKNGNSDPSRVNYCWRRQTQSGRFLGELASSPFCFFLYLGSSFFPFLFLCIARFRLPCYWPLCQSITLFLFQLSCSSLSSLSCRESLGT